MSNGWSDQRKERQSELIHGWKPWLKATGPKTEAGKRAVAKNALKHGLRSRAFQDEAKLLRQLIDELGAE